MAGIKAYRMKAYQRNVEKVIRELGGEPYRLVVIDFEPCVYRDLGDYDIEVSGCGNERGPYFIFVWKKEPYPHIVKRIKFIKTLTDLKAELFCIVKEFGNRDTITDSAMAFLYDACIISQDKFVYKPEFYVAYVKWCNNHNIKPLGKINFNKRIQELVPGLREKRARNESRRLEGVGLKPWKVWT